MRHRLSGRHLSRDTAHRTALYRNLVTDLLRHERITTTEAKAKEIRPMAEKIITLGKRGDLHARRQALRFIYDPKVVKKIFDEIAPRMSERPGGYLRITAVESRKGDGAKMAAIELVDLVDAPPTPRPNRATASPSARAVTLAPVAAAPAAAAAVEEVAPAVEESEAPEAAEEAVAEVVETPEAVVAAIDPVAAEAAEEDGETKE